MNGLSVTIAGNLVYESAFMQLGQRLGEGVRRSFLEINGGRKMLRIIAVSPNIIVIQKGIALPLPKTIFY